ncbi:MAG: hypothetical protein E7311_04225 [Clostridiales bacterium]|nr:hypothetical protein [Clostridiales bacterium]
MNVKSIIIFILGFIVGLVGYLIIDNMKPDVVNPNPDNQIISNEQTPTNEEKENIKIIEGELTGFADNHTVEIITEEGPISCHVYDENVSSKLEEVTGKNIKVEVKYNDEISLGVITKIL